MRICLARIMIRAVICKSAAESRTFMLFFLRHGQTEYNQEGRIQGRLDSPLTQTGRDQAVAQGQLLARLIGDQRVALLCSPLGRTLTSAELVAQQLHAKPTPEPHLHLIEASLGAWDGLTVAEIDSRAPGFRASFPQGDWLFNAPGGEAILEVEARLRMVLMELATRPEPVQIILAHGIIGRVLHQIHTGQPVRPNEHWPQHAVLELRSDGDIITHLPKMDQP